MGRTAAEGVQRSSSGFAMGAKEGVARRKGFSQLMRVVKVNFLKSFKSYMENTSVHGLKYIVEEDAHWIEKVFWIIVCGSCLFGTIVIFKSSWTSYKENPVSFVVETTYLDWNTTFPAVTVCEKRNPDKIELFSEKFYGADRNMNLDTYVGDIAFFSGSCTACNYHCGYDIDCLENLTFFMEKLRAPCNDIMKDCFYNGVEFDCCQEFEPVETGFGLCFTINSMQGNRSQTERNLNLMSNRITGPGVLTFRANEDIRIAIHSPEDVLFNHGSPDQFALVEYGQTLEMNFHVVEIVNDPYLRRLSVDSRNCRFPDENPLMLYPYYSYSACITECEAEAQVNLCGCNHHLMPKKALLKNPVCNITGLSCITEHKEELKALKNAWSDKPGLICDCLSSCTEQEFKILKSQLTDIKYEDDEDEANSTKETNVDYTSKVTVSMASLPSERLSRNVVRTRLDVIVSMGGTAGLFLGASILSIGEIIFYFIIRRPGRIANADRRSRFQAPGKRRRAVRPAYHGDGPWPGMKNPAVSRGDTLLW